MTTEHRQQQLRAAQRRRRERLREAGKVAVAVSLSATAHQALQDAIQPDESASQIVERLLLMTRHQPSTAKLAVSHTEVSLETVLAAYRKLSPDERGRFLRAVIC